MCDKHGRTRGGWYHTGEDRPRLRATGENACSAHGWDASQTSEDASASIDARLTDARTRLAEKSQAGGRPSGLGGSALIWQIQLGDRPRSPFRRLGRRRRSVPSGSKDRSSTSWWRFRKHDAWIMDGDLGPYDVLDVRLQAADTCHPAGLLVLALRLASNPALPRMGRFLALAVGLPTPEPAAPSHGDSPEKTGSIFRWNQHRSTAARANVERLARPVRVRCP
jgi:hypothetical protein